MKPTIGRIVIYRSRTGNYDVPAIITATRETLAEVGVALYRETRGEQGVPPLTGPVHEDRVHLHVLTPGIPGMRTEAQDFKSEGVRRAENIGGAYQEWDVPRFCTAPHNTEHGPEAAGEPRPGTWRWPERVA